MDLRPIRRKKLAWCNPVMIILIFLGIIGILILFLIQKRGTIYYYLSGGAADKLKKKLLINWGIFGLGVCLLASAALSRRANPELVTAGFATLLISALLGVTWCRLIKPRKIDKTHIWLLGIPPAVQEAIVAAEQESVQRAWR